MLSLNRFWCWPLLTCFGREFFAGGSAAAPVFDALRDGDVGFDGRAAVPHVQQHPDLVADAAQSEALTAERVRDSRVAGQALRHHQE